MQKTSRPAIALAALAALCLILDANPAGQARQIQPSSLPPEVRELLLSGGFAGAAGGAAARGGVPYRELLECAALFARR